MKILFVCTGNTCRSPLAEALARKVAIERGLVDVEVESAGTSAWEGSAASDGSLLVGMERHMDLSAHRSRLITKKMVEGADLVLAMGPHHLERVEALGGASKSFLITGYPNKDARWATVSDPVGGELAVYRDTADELEKEIRRIFDILFVAKA